MDAINSSREEADQQHGLGKLAGKLAGEEVRQLIGVVNRQHKIIVFTIVFVLASAVLALSLLEDRYTASAMLVVDESESQLLGIEAILSAGATLNNRVDTEVEVLRSSSVALRTIEKLKLWNDEEFGLLPNIWAKLRNRIGRSDSQEKISASTLAQLTNDQRAKLVDNLSDSLKVSRRGLTSVISIDATSLAAEKAAQVANAVAESYFDVQTEARAKSAQRAAEFLQARVDELAGVIRDDNQRIDQFMVDHRNDIGTPEDRAELTRLRNEMASMSREQATKSAQIIKLQQFQSDMNPVHFSELGFAAELQRLAKERNAIFNSSSAKIEASDAGQVGQLDARLQELATKEIDALREQISANVNRLTAVNEQVDNLVNRETLPQSMAVDLYRLQRDAETNRKLYDSYVTRLGEVQQKISLALPNSRLVAPAIVPHEPSFPPTAIILVLAAIAGVALGGGSAMLREHVVGGFASPEQLEAVTGLPVAAVTPHFGESNPHDAILVSPFSAFSESIRRLRIGIENLLNGKYPGVVLVTSTEPNEGKTTLAISLARVMAKSGRRTLLIDCDLRHSSVSRLIQNTSPVKLVELLLSPPAQEEFETTLGRDRDSDVYLISTESTKRHASDVLLASPEFRKLLEMAKLYFDVIIMDSPPIGFVVDANVISRECDVVLYVVRYAGPTQRDVVAGLREMLSGLKPQALLTVLNSAREGWGSYYYGKKRYDHYYEKT